VGIGAPDDSDRPAIDEITTLAIDARTGDPIAAAAFIRATQAEVWRFVAALVDPGAADDLTQETYLRAFRALPTFDARAAARTWLLAVARRTCADHIRAAVRSRRLAARVALVQPRPESEPVDLSATITSAELLRRLGPDQREAFVLTQVLGLSYEESARSLGVPIGTIRSRVARARSVLLAEVQRTLAV
jgi:RNA polymerase sigma-70 factor (ECF subfamily)